MSSIKVFFLFIFSTTIYANSININESTTYLDILSKAEIYLDKTKKLTVQDIQKSQNKFKKNSKSLIGFGYSPNFNVWIKFTLHNKTDKIIKRVIEYGNTLTTHVIFFDPNKNYEKKEEGLFYKNSKRKTVNPTFEIELSPNQTATYYLKVYSFITTLIVKVNLWEESNFFNKEIKHQIVLAIFFGSMFILGIYNLFIYFFTKDKSYLYYVMYIIGIMIHHLLYVGYAKLYLLDNETMIKAIGFAPLIVAFPVYALGLFTKSFLQTSQYKIHDKILKAFLFLIPISIVFFLLTDEYDKFRNTITMLFLLYLMHFTLFASIKKNKQAYFILFGWIIFLTSGMLMFLSSAGVFNIYEYMPYLIETSFITEAIIFSIALANRINDLQKERNIMNERLIEQQKTETNRLFKKVEEKTLNLRKILDEKDLLLKELNHRVKNNMQMIVSLIRLQNDKIENRKLQDVLITIQNRISAMSHLHELLYRQNDISHISAFEYFETLTEEVKYSYDKVAVEISYDIQTDLDIEQTIYCGLILNELITNSFKYAFVNNQGEITIKLLKKDSFFTLIVKDNGIGYENISQNTLGLTLVTTLVTDQLGGEIQIDSKNHVKTTIKWKN